VETCGVQVRLFGEVELCGGGGADRGEGARCEGRGVDSTSWHPFSFANLQVKPFVLGTRVWWWWRGGCMRRRWVCCGNTWRTCEGVCEALTPSPWGCLRQCQGIAALTGNTMQESDFSFGHTGSECCTCRRLLLTFRSALYCC
jgi:hypothetical protein